MSINAMEDIDLFGINRSAQFPSKGTTVEGVILGTKTAQQRAYKPDAVGDLLFWEDGKPKLQLVIRLQTEIRDPEDDFDDGIRNIYAKKGKHLYKAIQEAARKGGARSMADLVGGTLRVTYDKDVVVAKGVPTAKGYSVTFTKGEVPADGADLF